MSNSKNSKLFCLTSYKKWLAVLCVMVIVMIVWIAVGFDEDRAKANMNRMTAESQAFEDAMGNGQNDGIFGHLHMAKLQESYSDVASKAREVTVNISASRNAGPAGGSGLAFVDPFGDVRQKSPVRGEHIPQTPPSIIGVMAAAPPITASAKMPHKYRGVCSNCHKVNNRLSAKDMAAQPQSRISVGSGIIVDSSGYILTNYHVINNANNIIVTIANGNKYRADVSYTDLVGDLAILKINSAGKLPAAVLGDSDIIQEGDIALAVGSPFGLNQTVTAGIISNTHVTASISGRPFTGLIQTDAAINRGSSGGPLVNIKGEVVGINTAIYSITGDFTGVGFAIPINRAKETFMAVPSLNAMAANMIDLNVGEIITVAMQTNVPEAWFGAEVSSIDPVMAEQFGLHNRNGVLVNRVFTDSPAEISGIKRGDVIVKINGRNIADINKFRKITSSLAAGRSINITINRNNKKTVLTAKLEKRRKGKIKRRTTAAAAGPPEMEWAGMEVVPITPQLAKKYGIRKGERGVVALEVEGMAAAAGIMRGDVIKGLNRKRIQTMSDFMNGTANASFADGVLFDISRQGDPLFITM